MKLLTGGARDRPSRQQTLRGAIDWSYLLLTEEERVLFARLSVFSGSCTLDAVEAIGNAGADLGMDCIDGISSLVEKSLARQIEDDASEEPRFALLETIREYAGEKLVDLSEAETVRELHFRYFTALAETGYSSIVGDANPGRSTDWLARDNDNVTAALRWAIDRRDAPGALRLAAYLCMLWNSRGLWHEAELWTNAALALATPGQFQAEHGLLLLTFGIRSAISGDTERGIARILEGQELLEQAGDRQNATRALAFAGLYMSASGDTERGLEHLARALDRARQSGDWWAVATGLSALAQAAIVADDLPLARRYAEEAITWLPPTQDTYTLANTHNVLGDISRLEGAYGEAREHYERALALAEELGWHGLVPSMRHNLAWALHGLGDDEGAVEYFSATAREFQRMGDTRGLAECLVGLACAARRPEIATRLFAAGHTILGESGMTLSHPNQREYARESAQTRSVLGEEAWQAAWAEGAKLTPDQALALVVPAVPA